MLVALFKNYIHGHSGNELPPPVERVDTFVVCQESELEPEDEFRSRTHARLVDLRRYAEAQPVRPYSSRDGWDLEWHPVREPSTPRPIPPLLLKRSTEDKEQGPA